MEILDIRHDFPKNAGYRLDRPNGRNYFIFAHYYAPVRLRLGDREFSVSPGSCVLIRPGTPQHLECDQPLIHNWIHFDCDAQSLAPYSLPLDEPFTVANHHLLSNMVRQMEIEFFSHEIHRQRMLECSMHRLLIWLDRALHKATGDISVPKSIRPAISQLRQELLLHPEQKHTIEQMAKRVSLSPSRFHAVYKAMFGTTPNQDQITARIENARALLVAHPELSIPEAAARLGYNDQYHFIRQFKAVTGQTPGTYRNDHTSG